MSALQVQAEEQAGADHTVRTWLPARHVSTVHAHALQLQPVGRPSSEFLRACTYLVFAFVTFGRPDTGVAMLRQHISIAHEVVSVVLHKEKGRRHVRLKRRLTIPAAGVPGLVQLLQHWEHVRDALAVGALLERCCFLGGWSPLSSAIQSYIDPTATPDEHMEKYFGWTTPRWREQQPGTRQCA
ncbi:hypothetical protein CYMTET_46197 [Cymbomonas tetramitiformis]|uniref:Uncharacterized protein n=1 Tax=Cymbomonas tetramitiformis TaxID=36881 RepID=A0AAE0BXY5_9CHLO|nr:hypothetical protein CYMTET_46197 [Cymbomonas tetramitiformis]